MNGVYRWLRILSYIGIGLGGAGLLYFLVIPLLFGGKVRVLATVCCVIDLIFDIHTIYRTSEEVDEIPTYAKYQDGIPHPGKKDTEDDPRTKTG